LTVCIVIPSLAMKEASLIEEGVPPRLSTETFAPRLSKKSCRSFSEPDWSALMPIRYSTDPEYALLSMKSTPATETEWLAE